MIKYNGITTKNNLYYIVFSNETGIETNVPIDMFTAEMIKSYIAEISTADVKTISRGNDEEAE